MTADEYTLQEFFLDVGNGHQLYVKEWGNPRANTPIVFLHGGPGNGVDNRDQTKFDAATQRIIFFDQRGCGKSIPLGSLEDNTTADLVEDIEKIAKHLKVDKFVITGSSWGAFLALMYGIAHPTRLAGMVIQGVFTGTHDEIDWLEKGRFQDFFPDAWDRYIEATPASHRYDPTAYHFKQALGSDPVAAKISAYAYENLEASLIKLNDHIHPKDFETYDPLKIRTEIYYMAHKCFVPNDYILKNAAKLTMPVWMVQGRYDMVCRPLGAYRLHQKLTHSELIWTINGHLAEHEAANVLRLALQHLTGVM